MKIKTSKLTGPALDWAVAKCETKYTVSVDTDIDGTKRVNYGGMYSEWSTDWSQGGPIIERERLDINYRPGEKMWTALWVGGTEYNVSWGDTPLIAAMRCFCCSKLGDVVDIPEELCQQQNS